MTAKKDFIKVDLRCQNLLRVPILQHDENKRPYIAESITLIPGENTLTPQQMRLLTENKAFRTRYLDKGLVVQVP